MGHRAQAHHRADHRLRATLHITVHTKPQCYPCRFTKQKLDQLGIEYTTTELTPESAAEFREQGLLAAPVVVVDLGDGATWTWSGHAPTQIERLTQFIATGEIPAAA